MFGGIDIQVSLPPGGTASRLPKARPYLRTLDLNVDAIEVSK